MPRRRRSSWSASCAVEYGSQESSHARSQSRIAAACSAVTFLTIGSASLELDAEYPKGFYLRVIDGRPWLRGYRCDDEYVWGAGDRLVFASDGRGRRK